MRIAEIADNFTKYTQTSIEKKLEFSDTVKEEIGSMVQRVETLYGLTRQMIRNKDAGLLPQIAKTEDEIDAFRKRLIDNHIERLNSGQCRPESSGVFINLVSNLERLGDHLTYITEGVSR